jgi:uncharacterized phage protein gp47/JayE
MPGPYPLPTLAAQINEFGITAPTYEDILASLQESYRQIYGSDVNLDFDTQDGQWVAIHAQAVYDMNQALIAGYLSYSPASALGVGLSNVVKINGIARLIPTNSTVELALVGQAGVIVNNGVVSDLFQNIWNLPPTVTIPVEGTVTVTATAANTGAVQAAPNTVTIIQSPVPGWQTVTNPQAAFVGMPLETDATLRKRQARSTALPSITPLEGIDAAVAMITGVGRSKVYQNDTPFPDSNLIPPHSISVVTEGGDAAAIAQAIEQKKNVGAGTYGSTQVIVTDSKGVPLAINFFYLTQITVYVAISLYPLAGYVSTTGDLITSAVAQYINDLDIGEDVYRSRLLSPANLAGDSAMFATGMSQAQLDQFSNTYVIRTLSIGPSASPAGLADMVIAFNAAASGDPANITIAIANPQGAASAQGAAHGVGVAR